MHMQERIYNLPASSSANVHRSVLEMRKMSTREIWIYKILMKILE